MLMPKTVLVTGACGYIGSVLTPLLVAKGHRVRAFDTQWFGQHLAPHENLTVVKGDVRTLDDAQLAGVDAIIHLASIANDPCGELNAKVRWEVDAFSTLQLADKAVRHRVAQFIYASSGSIYGVKQEVEVVESLPLEPISDFNKSKMVAERVLLSYRDRMHVQIVRPATVCGLSPRMRLDVLVNRLTMQALTLGRITVVGGEQIRPNIHIEDLCRWYVFMLDYPGATTGVFNAGFENLSIQSIAERVAEKVDCDITVTASQDPCSYRLNSDKLRNTGFELAKGVDDAIDELIDAYRVGRVLDEPVCHNVHWMKKHYLHQSTP